MFTWNFLKFPIHRLVLKKMKNYPSPNSIILFYFLWEGEKEAEKHWCEKHQLIASHMHAPWMGTKSHNQGMHPDQESNRWPFGLWDDTQPTEPHQSEPSAIILNTVM